ncbi:putative tartrate transporter [Colletotrichum orbiculare MAFF 240422]|uniref:Tartrate transporter n=1 Tax=Colletotrichum orbiculare (strain 104-T / ATCC 96160 / CBS 514.97 / LARS 414 / MAFF 240422) TaxID=1213857 RepID=A0A484FHP5_COLOR|nr:putative tartrate transporter [Colletotrichum orbiculare MAFF 240422]
MTDIKAAKDQPPGIAQDMAEAYTVKVNLSEHELELEQNIGNAKVAGMEADLNLTDDQYAMLLSIFFIGYLACEVPSNMILTRSRPSWYLPGIMIIWGSICAVMSVVKNYHGMLALRFFLGCIEAGFFPGVLYFILLDFPGTTRRLSLEERQLAVVRMMHDRNTTAAGHGRRLTHWQSLKAALADPRTYVFAVLFAMDLGSFTISYFIPAIVRQMGYASTTAQYMTMPIWTVGAAFLVALSYTADRTGDRRWHVTGGAWGSVSSARWSARRRRSRGVVYAMLCFYVAGLYTALPLMLNWASEVVALPAEKRAVVVALVNSVGNLSAVYGSRLWPSSDGPRFVKGFATTGAFTGFGTLLAAAIPVIFSYLPSEGNTRAEREILAREREFVEHTRAPGQV